MKILDALDKKILCLIDMQGQMPTSQLAKKCRSSREVIEYRLKRLEERGVTSGIITFFNKAKLGKTLYRILFRIDNTQTTQVNEFIIAAKEVAMWIGKTTGRWDYIIEIYAESAKQISTILHILLQSTNTIVYEYEVMAVIDIYAYPRKYLGKSQAKKIYLGGAVEYNLLDELENEICNQLATNGKMSITELSRKTDTNRLTIRKRIKKLTEQGIILNHRAFIHPQKIGLISYKIFLSTKFVPDKIDKQFFTFCELNQSVVYAHRNLGRWNYEVEVEIESLESLEQLLQELRKIFNTQLSDYEFLQITKDIQIKMF